MTAAVSPASPGDRSTIVSDLIEAFMEDPVLCWAFPHPGRRHRYGRHFFAMHTRRLAGAGLAWRCEGGAALWAPPDRWRESPLESLRVAIGSAPGTRLRGLRVGRGMLAVENRHPAEPHLYLAVVGVRPEHQGRGLGSALLQPGLAAADARGLPAYLESSNERNVPLYERHGFRVTAEHRLPQGPPMWLMWRPARS